MGVAERKEREKLERRNLIIQAAERVFFKIGIDNASMEQVAQEAELSKGTLYLYFKSKEDLYRSIILKGFIILKRKLKESLNILNNGFQDVKNISESYIKFSSEYEGYFDAILHYQNDLFNSRNREPEQVQSLESGNAVIAVLIHALEKGIKDESIDPKIQPIETAFVLWSQLTGLLQVIQRKMKIIAYHYRIKQNDLFESYFVLLENSLKKR